MHTTRIPIILAGLLALLPSPCRAAEAKPETHYSWFDPYTYVHYAFQAGRGAVRNVQQIEAVEMLSAIASGSQMGPGDGWFHPGQSRYDWKWLAARYDANGDGVITRKEFTGPAELFDRLDRNRDGVITPEDFDWSDRSLYLRQLGMAEGLFRRIDRDSNGRISRDELDAFFKKMAKGKDHLTPEDLREALFPPAPPPPKPGAGGGGPSPMLLVRGLLQGEIGSMHEGPALNAKAPEFSLKTEDGKQTIALSQFRDKKPVVLIFGSFT
jgi:hypothetical protein